MPRSEDHHRESDEDASTSNLRASLIRSTKIALVALSLILGGLAITALMTGGDSTDLPFEYEGFD